MLIAAALWFSVACLAFFLFGRERGIEYLLWGLGAGSMLVLTTAIGLLGLTGQLCP